MAAPLSAVLIRVDNDTIFAEDANAAGRRWLGAVRFCRDFGRFGVGIRDGAGTGLEPENGGGGVMAEVAMRKRVSQTRRLALRAAARIDGP